MKTLTLKREALNQGSLLLVNARHPLPESVDREGRRPFNGTCVLRGRRAGGGLGFLVHGVGGGSSVRPGLP